MTGCNRPKSFCPGATLFRWLSCFPLSNSSPSRDVHCPTQNIYPHRMNPCGVYILIKTLRESLLSGLGRVVEYVSECKIHLALRETVMPNPGFSILICPITHKHDIYWKKTFIAGTWLLITGVSQEERHCWLKMRRTMIQRLKYERSVTDQLLYTSSHAKLNYSVTQWRLFLGSVISSFLVWD